MRSIKQDEYFREYVRGKTNNRISALFLDGYTADMNLSPAMREANGLCALWSAAPLSVYPHELIVGGIYATEVAGFHYGDGVWVNDERLTAYIEKHGLDDSYREKAESVLKCVYQNPYNRYFDPSLYTPEELASIRSTAASSTWFGGHLSMDYETILSIGLGGYADCIEAARTNHPDSSDYYDALTITLKAVQTLIKRTANRCGELAAEQTDPELKDNMVRAEIALRAIVSEPPTTFHQALQLVTIVHICSDADSFGRFDSYLRPFFEADIQAGRLTEEYALDLLQSLVIKVEQQDQIQNMTIGGILPNGDSGYNTLTQLMLKAVRSMGYKGPNLCMRVHPDILPQSLWQDITDTIATGQGLPALYNDSVIVSTLTGAGYPLELARDYCLGGCSQIMFGGRCQFVNDIGMMNIAKIIELTLHNGRDFLRNEPVGPQTGEVADFKGFDALYDAFNRQLEYFIALEASINNKDIIDRGSKEGYTLRSLFTRGCIESGKGVYEGGALYNHVQLECIGITNAADSLYAIKQAVYTDNRLTLSELVDVLDTNFESAEAMRAVLRKADKFGNDSDGVDSIRADITRRLHAGLRAQKGAFGGNYVPGEVIFTAHEHCGYAVAATPDGRYAREVLADSAGSSQGMDMHGPTALMNSVLKIPIEGMITSVVLNMKFHRNFFKENADMVAALFRGYFAGGGEQLQINVCDNEELKRALLYPEQYQNLVVRVGGYSDYFVRLNRRLQEEIILRSNSIM